MTDQETMERFAHLMAEKDREIAELKDRIKGLEATVPSKVFRDSARKIMDDMVSEHQKLFHANSSMSVKIERLESQIIELERIQKQMSDCIEARDSRIKELETRLASAGEENEKRKAAIKFIAGFWCESCYGTGYALDPETNMGYECPAHDAQENAQ